MRPARSRGKQLFNGKAVGDVFRMRCSASGQLRHTVELVFGHADKWSRLS